LRWLPPECASVNTLRGESRLEQAAGVVITVTVHRPCCRCVGPYRLCCVAILPRLGLRYVAVRSSLPAVMCSLRISSSVILFRLQQVCVEPPPSALNVTLPAFAAERRRDITAAPAAIDRPPARRAFNRKPVGRHQGVVGRGSGVTASPHFFRQGERVPHSPTFWTEIRAKVSPLLQLVIYLLKRSVR